MSRDGERNTELGDTRFAASDHGMGAGAREADDGVGGGCCATERGSKGESSASGVADEGGGDVGV